MPTGSAYDMDAAYAGGALNVRMPAPRIDLDPDGPSVSVIIPAINEARNLPWLAERMPGGVAEVILVDGRSMDDTVAVARSLWPDVRVINQTRRGKGNALACGLHAATGDILVTIDADGSMDPGEIPYFVEALVSGADYAKGSRFTPGGGSSDITRFRTAGNRALNQLTGYVHKTRYTDLCYGYNAFWRPVLPILGLDPGVDDDCSPEIKWGDGFEVETLLNIRVHLAGLSVMEIPSYETPRIHGRSNLNAVSDGARVLRTIARESRALRRGVHLHRSVVAKMVGQRPNSLKVRQTSPLAADTAPEYSDRTIDLAGAETAAADVKVVDLVAYEREREHLRATFEPGRRAGTQ